MTSSGISSDEQWPVDPNTATLSAPRKKKRQQRSGGATEDCFTCRTRGRKCDRKRPYCTQCIEIGKECTGYKTTLTWDVGVASRGKLRGLACPVANKNVDGSDVSRTESSKSPSERRRSSSTANIKKEDGTGNIMNRHVHEIPGSIQRSASASASHREPAYADTQMLMPPLGFHDHVQSVASNRAGTFPPNYPILQSLEDSLSRYEDVQLPNSSRSVGSYPEQEYYSPMEYEHTSTSLPLYDSMPPTTSNMYPERPMVTSTLNDFSVGATSMDPFANSINYGVPYLHDPQAASGARDDDFDQVAIDSLNDALFSRGYPGSLPYGPSNASDVQNQDDNTDYHRKDILLTDSRFSSPFSHISPRLQSWMDYYDHNICPFLVAFDGPDNPYRKHVLQLAMENEGLQHAIAALSTNNLRMRKKEYRRFGFADEITDAFRDTPSRDIGEPSSEELYYKRMSIDQLNLQLTNRRAPQDDSVLATLLILCLFHVCDSGFSRFKTQLAGVQKLLALREPATQSNFSRWIHMFFTWFDAMTSAVNDREMQVRGDPMAMLDFSSNLGAMEQFSGCDGKLFKLIARLGRLNLLAQGRPVSGQSGNRSSQRQVYAPRTSFHQSQERGRSGEVRTNKSPSFADYADMDDNNWAAPTVFPVEKEGPVPEDDSLPEFDIRSEVWAEWSDIRSKLQSFQMDLPRIPSATSPNIPSDPAELEAGQRDLIHINECFRCSALLYTERLAYPSRSSSHHAFQRLVLEALYHITALGIHSCVNKFLLWPLFIIGTECIDERHRDVVRKRCVEVQKESGFYNNISTLEVLEKVWMEANKNSQRTEAEEVQARRRYSEATRSGRYGQPFYRWRKAMDRVDGEYIVV